ncbi:MAG: T9SS type A sorting domain-containing protein [Parafilimonas sp.]|nr:T9SS type A sorting domain-containing protein [Parafilimonas sp.]
MINSNSYSQWQFLNPKPSGYNNNKVVFVSSQKGFILNSNGDLFLTNNAGKSWLTKRNFANALTMEVKDSLAIISGANGTLYTSIDTGISWKQITTGINDVFSDICIVSRDTFFLISNYHYSYGNIYKTENRGKTFIKLNCGVPVHSVYFVNSNIGFVGSSLSTILKTTDGGKTWYQKRQVSFAPSSVLAMQFINKDTGYAIQEYDSLLITNNGGKTWKTSSIGGTFSDFAAIDFVNSQDGFAAGSDGAIYVTHNGGKKFKWAGFDGLRDGNNIYSIDFLSADTGFAVGELGRIIKTADGGLNWSAYSPTYFPITSVYFGTASIGFTTDWNYVYKTSNKGQTWIKLNLSTGLQYASSSRFEKSYFVNADTGFVTSSYPELIHHTYDGGQTWDTINLSKTYDYDVAGDLQFINRDTGFITINQFSSGASGSIIKTINGGLTWKKIWEPIIDLHEYFDKICFLNNDTGYATRYSELYKTTNGAKTWKKIYSSPDYYKLTGVAFTSTQRGFIADEDGNIISTNNGGKKWKTSRPDSYVQGINTLKFYNAAIGYFTAGNQFGTTDYGFIYKTIDSGKTWQLQKNLGGNAINFTPDSLVIINGFGGVILSSKIFDDSLMKRSSPSHIDNTVDASSELHTITSFSVVPNPAKNGVRLTFTKTISITSIEVLDENGKTISLTNIDKDCKDFYLNTSNFKNGLYVIIVHTKNNETFTQKLMVIK